MIGKPSEYDHPNAGDVVGDRTVINVRDTFLIFGQREGDVPNCGAYVTSYREWFAYERDILDALIEQPAVDPTSLKLAQSAIRRQSSSRREKMQPKIIEIISDYIDAPHELMVRCADDIIALIEQPPSVPGVDALREALEDIATLQVTGGAAANRAQAVLESLAAPPSMEREKIRDILAKSNKCWMPCACLINTQPGDCASIADAILALIEQPG